MGIGELHALRGHSIEGRRGDFAMGVEWADVADAEIVGENEDDVRLLRRMRAGQQAEEANE